jgi:hypothetical protein
MDRDEPHGQFLLQRDVTRIVATRVESLGLGEKGKTIQLSRALELVYWTKDVDLGMKYPHSQNPCRYVVRTQSGFSPEPSIH